MKIDSDFNLQDPENLRVLLDVPKSEFVVIQCRLTGHMTAGLRTQHQNQANISLRL